LQENLTVAFATVATVWIRPCTGYYHVILCINPFWKPVMDSSQNT
jgi:hypothetical protein